MGKRRVGEADPSSAADAMASQVIGGFGTDESSRAAEVDDWRVAKGFGVGVGGFGGQVTGSGS